MKQTNETYDIEIANITKCDAGIYECSVVNPNSSVDLFVLNVFSRDTTWKRKSDQEIAWAKYIRDLFIINFRLRNKINI
jgi:hypothetical protein